MEEYSEDTTANVEATHDVFDIESLLVPISEDNPCGEYLIYSNEYDDIRNARMEDNPNLPLGVWEHDLKKANWQEVIRLCEQILRTRSKDLLVAGWLCEAALSIHGLKGLHDGLTLILQLSQTFWDTIHPRFEENDYSGRIAPFIWLNKALSARIQFITITEETSTIQHTYTFADWVEAEHLQQIIHKGPELLQQAREAGKPTRDDINSAAAAVDNSFFLTLTQQLNDCITLVYAIEALLDDKCGAEAPGFIALRSRLQSIATKTSSWIREGEIPESAILEETSEEHTKEEGTTQPVARPQGPRAIDSRATAYRMLNEAADYLLTIEPHSPTPYLVKRAVTWGNMSLSELFTELINEGRDLNSTLTLLGITGQNIY